MAADCYYRRHPGQPRGLRHSQNSEQVYAAGLKPAAEVGQSPKQGRAEAECYSKQLAAQSRLPRP
jgi:hypothetical protein